MADCCRATETAHGEIACSACRTKGQTVDLLTVKALLTESALRRLRPGPHRFCPDAACDVTYFDETGNVFTKTDVRVPVWQKEPTGARIVCYCFGENEADIRKEMAQTGASGALRRLREHIAAGRCACEARNPRGVCCLGDVMRAVERMQAVETPAVRK